MMQFLLGKCYYTVLFSMRKPARGEIFRKINCYCPSCQTERAFWSSCLLSSCFCCGQNWLALVFKLKWYFWLFCRFHPLSEFDEGKRSCRRRLAGHNRRRRKTQPEDVSSKLLISGNPENNNGGNLDIVNLITILARLQGKRLLF